jgi:hypothetical protein
MVSKNRIGNHSMNLLAAVATYREDDGTVSLPATVLLRKSNSPQQNNRPIIFVCHSLGGLVCENVSYPAHLSIEVQALTGTGSVGGTTTAGKAS